MRIVRAQITDVCRHLAAEEWLLTERDGPSSSFFLWQSDGAVVIGKNQNPWAECAMHRLAAEGVRLGRRVSGGGAVFHDRGNLNYAVVMPRAEYQADRMFKRVLRALQKAGIFAERLGRSSLGCAGRKFSGTAFCYRGDRALHHGTLLIRSDLAKLERLLQPACASLRTRAMVSEPAPVMNLADVLPDLTVERAGEALAEAMAHDASCDAVLEPWAGDPRYDELCRRHASSEWLLGRTPAFEADHDIAHGSETLFATLTVNHAVITDLRWRRSPPREVDAAAFAASWRGAPYERFLNAGAGERNP